MTIRCVAVRLSAAVDRVTGSLCGSPTRSDPERVSCEPAQFMFAHTIMAYGAWIEGEYPASMRHAHKAGGALQHM